MVNVTELLSKYLKPLKPLSGPRWTMEALDLLSKCPSSSPPQVLKPFSKESPHRTHNEIEHENLRKADCRWPLVYKLSDNESTYLPPIPFKRILELDLLDLCVFLFLVLSFFHRSVFVPPLASWISRDVLLATRSWSEKSSKATFVKDGRGRAPLGRWGR